MKSVFQVKGASRPVTVETPSARLDGDLFLPPGARALVVFAHGSGSSRHSPRNRAVAGWLAAAGLAALLFDLLTPQEEAEEEFSRHHRFNIPFLSERLLQALRWVRSVERIPQEAIGLFGSSTGAAAALEAAAGDSRIQAVVSRGGRPDLSRKNGLVQCPVLLIVGSLDIEVLELNRMAAKEISRCELAVVPGATHLFSEPGTLEQAGKIACEWFLRHLM
jgi:putative phosphoribosyl transferase